MQVGVICNFYASIFNKLLNRLSLLICINQERIYISISSWVSDWLNLADMVTTAARSGILNSCRLLALQYLPIKDVALGF